jgi:hypothetical protein
VQLPHGASYVAQQQHLAQRETLLAANRGAGQRRIAAHACVRQAAAWNAFATCGWARATQQQSHARVHSTHLLQELCWRQHGAHAQAVAAQAEGALDKRLVRLALQL